MDEFSKYRQEPELIKKLGYIWDDPWDIIGLFERKVAEFAGANFAVAVDCCTNGLYLSMMLRQEQLVIVMKTLETGKIVSIPKHTWFSVPMAIVSAGLIPAFYNNKWKGGYLLEGLNIWDGAVRWKRGMYKGGLHVLSFHIKKNLPIGRGGMILTDSKTEYKELVLMRYDGRDMGTDRMNKNHIRRFGYHMYMTPEDAARGLLLMHSEPGDKDDVADWNDYPDISKILKNYLHETN